MNTYASLHNHTCYSNIRLIDSMIKIDDLIDMAVELNLKGVAITEHDCVSSHLKALKKYDSLSQETKDNFKIILGNEIYLTKEGLSRETHEKGEKFFHLILLAKDKIGHEQIRKISSRAWERSYVRNMIRTPTYSSDLYEVISENPGHIIATTACLGGYCGNNFLSGDYDKIDRHLLNMEELFGKDNFFIEIQPSQNSEQIAYNTYMTDKYWNRYQFIVSTDSHYLYKEDRKIHKIFLNSNDGEREVDNFYQSAYMMSAEEISELLLMNKIDSLKIQKMFKNTIEISNRIEIYDIKSVQEIPKIRYEAQEINIFYDGIIKQFPDKTEYIARTINKNNQSDIHLLNLVANGWEEKLLNIDIEKYVIELEYEIKQLYIISEKLGVNLSDYFITMSKFIDLIWDEGDSIVGVSRGSAASSLICYLTGITQINPLEQPFELPFWRFIHADRPELPDIDIDTESSKRLKIFNRINSYMRSIGGDLINVCTFGTEKSKSAIRTASRGLGIEQEVASYITSMIPNTRGIDLTISQCYYGDKENAPIRSFVEEMDKHDMLLQVALKIEGLVTRLGSHAGGVIAINEEAYKKNSLMRTSQGTLVTAFELEDTELMGGLKYDFLTIKALDKIRTTLNLLLEDEVIQWQGSLRQTYDTYLKPEVLIHKDPDMWKFLHNGEIPSCFQFDTPVGTQAVKMIQPTTLAELAIGNSVMRLSSPGEEQPLETYAKYKNDISLWYEELDKYMLKQEEIAVLEKHLLPLSGVADSQESVMKLVMDDKVAGFTLSEANKLRKGIAKKKADVLKEVEDMFFSKGFKLGVRAPLLNYIWNVQIKRQLGYSFSVIHTTGYSYIALQEMNLFYRYPSIYWKTACLSVDADAVSEEDYYNLIDEGLVEILDDEDKKDSNKIDYGKVASAISKMENLIKIELPNINVARTGFTPNVKSNSITFGLKGIARVGGDVITNIIINRPYNSLKHFIEKMVDNSNKKLISKDKVINLIKAGAFDEIENKPREQILNDYILEIADQKQKLNLMNFLMIIRKKLITPEVEETAKVYNFNKYIRKFKYKGNYILDEKSSEFYTKKYGCSGISVLQNEASEFLQVISQSKWEIIYQNEMNVARNWIKKHHDELLVKLNDILFSEEKEKYMKGNILDWELQSLGFFYSGHPLEGVNIGVEVDNINNIIEDDFDGSWVIKNKIIPRYKLSKIFGTVIAKNKAAGIVTLSTLNGVVNIKLFKQLFAKYDQEEDNNPSFFEKGTHLLVTGILKGENFIPKVYKSTGHEMILKVVLKEKELDYFLKKE